MARAVTMACGGSVSVSLYAMEGKFMKEYGVRGIITRSEILGSAIRKVKEAVDQDGFLGLFRGGFKAAAVGTSAALVFSYLASLIFQPKMKK